MTNYPRPSEQSLSYGDAGVDISAGNRLIEQIRPFVKATMRPGVLADIGGFGGLFSIDTARFPAPVLVSGTDGVGTKLKLAFEMERHDTIGMDLVAMCVNDIIVQGAEPLFFLDYFATGRLSQERAKTVIRGIAEGCQQSGCALLGGETAEMPGMYNETEYDLAGFAVGIVNRDKLIDGTRIACGDAIIGLSSSGPHSNGYSLIRKILEVGNHDLKAPFGDNSLGETLLTPTKLYVKPLLELFSRIEVHGLAHITGGGLTENLPRMIPDNMAARVAESAWQWPEIFIWLQKQGNIETEEMYRTFNCGIGMCVIVESDQARDAVDILRDCGESAVIIGTITAGNNQRSKVEFIT